MRTSVTSTVDLSASLPRLRLGGDTNYRFLSAPLSSFLYAAVPAATTFSFLLHRFFCSLNISFPVLFFCLLFMKLILKILIHHSWKIIYNKS